VGFLFSFCLACLVRVRAPSQARQKLKRKPTDDRYTDDSGSKLRDKEQQRLSSK